MQRRVLDRIGFLAAAGVAAGLIWAGRASASVEVRGSIEGAGAASAEVTLLTARPLYDLLAAVLADDPAGLFPVESTVRTVDGRFAFEGAEPDVRWVRVRRGGSVDKALLVVGPQTDTLLRPLQASRGASCTLSLLTPGSAWVVAGRSPRDLRYSRSWNTWPRLNRLEAGGATRYGFDAGRRVRFDSGVRRDSVTLAVGAPGYEPAVVECESGATVSVELERTTVRVVRGQLRRGGSTLAQAILVRADGWPVATTDESGRYRAPAGAYTVLGPDGSTDAVELAGGVVELGASAPPPVAVQLEGVNGDAPPVLVAHWTSSAALLALDRGRPESVRFRVGAAPGVARTSVVAGRFAPLTVTWSGRPVALSLEPLRRLEGVTTDLVGTPVVGAEVSVAASGVSSFGVSDGAGRFLVEYAEPLNRSRLVARAPGYRETSRELDGVLSGAAPEPLVVEMPTTPAIVGRLVSAGSGGAVGGTVGLALAPAVSSFVGDVGLWDLGDPMVLRVLSTGDDGVFRLEPVDKEHVRLLAAAPGHGTTWRTLPDPLPGARGDQELGDLVLEPELVLRGRVIDEDGGPVAGATVDFGAEARFQMGAGSASIADVASDDGGRFRIGGLAPRDTVSLSVRAPGFVAVRLPRLAVDALDVEEVEVRLQRAMELSGRVVDEVTGDGIGNAQLRFDQTVRDGDAHTESDENGDFVLGGFPAGAGVLTARAPGYERLERSLAEVLSDPLELVLRPEPEIDVFGVVIRDGAPVSGASIRVRSAIAVTDASGRFALKASPGRTSLECRVPGAAQPSRRQIEVSDFLGEITIDVTPIAVRGRVIGPDGMPVPAASVHAWRGTGLRFFYGGRGEHRAGPQGDFELEAEPGLYTLMARRDNAQGPEVEVSLVAGDSPYVELTVPESRLLRIRILGLTAAEALEVEVFAQASFEPGGSIGIGMRRVAGGSAVEPAFEAEMGDWDAATIVAIATVGDRSRRTPLQLAPRGVTEIDISFADRRGRVEGMVTLNGLPLVGEGVFVSAEREALTWTVRTDHRGGFVIDGLKVGDEVVVAAVGESRTVRVTETARVDLDARSAAVRGRVVDAETGLPAVGMRVAAVPALIFDITGLANTARRRISTRTGADGAFVLDGLFAVPYRLEIRRPGFDVSAESLVGSSDVDLSAGDLDVTLAVRAP